MSVDKSMTKERRNLLETCFDHFYKISDFEKVCEILNDKRILSCHDLDSIKTKGSKNEKLLKFLQLLKTKGNNAYEEFYNILIYLDYYDIARMLERLIINPQSDQIIHSNIHKPFNFKCPNDVINKEDAAFDNIKMIPCQSANAYDLDYYKSDMNGIYPNFTSPRGLALIINNHRFKSMSDRTGTDVDKENLRILFRKLDYKTVEYTDLTGQEMLSTIKGFGRLEEHKTYHSTIVCVLTHGDNNALVGVDDNKVDVNEFIATLNNGNCPNLSQKPKLFFIQACRGGEYDHGVYSNNVCESNEVDRFTIFGNSKKSSKENSKEKSGGIRINKVVRNFKVGHSKIPVEADIFVAYSTPYGYVSWRNQTRGSWFIQKIYQIFHENAHKCDINALLTKVKCEVTKIEGADARRSVQIPETVSRLTKNFYFFPGVKINKTILNTYC